MSPYVRTVKTTSGATAVQIVHSSRRGSRDIEHLGSAHDEVELELLKAAARQRLAAGQGELDLGLEVTEPGRRGAGGGPLPITSTRMGHLLDSLERAYRELGFAGAADADEVFLQLVLARIIEPVSKLDSVRVLEEAGVAAASYRTVTRRLRAYARQAFRQKLSALSWAILVRKSVVAVDGVEGLAQVVRERVGGGDGLPSRLDLDGAVAAGCLDEFPG